MNFWRRKPSLDAPKSKTAVDIAHKKKQLQTAGLKCHVDVRKKLVCVSSYSCFLTSVSLFQAYVSGKCPQKFLLTLLLVSSFYFSSFIVYFWKIKTRKSQYFKLYKVVVLTMRAHSFNL